MEKSKNKQKNVAERITYAYIRKIKKWMFCPNCQQGKMIIDKKSILWTCKECGYALSADEFEDDYVFWLCDKCSSYLNNQDGFSQSAAKYVCKKCGYTNNITDDNIKDENEIDTVDFDYYFAQLKIGKLVDETCFYFVDDPKETEHYIGYLPEYEKPYWSGYCDIPDGTEYKTAEELINAPIWNGKSLKERWEDVRICHIEGISLNEWLKQKHNSNQ